MRTTRGPGTPGGASRPSITSARPYRNPMSDQDAIDLIRSESGRIFDPALVEVFLEAMQRKLRTAG